VGQTITWRGQLLPVEGDYLDGTDTAASEPDQAGSHALFVYSREQYYTMFLQVNMPRLATAILFAEYFPYWIIYRLCRCILAYESGD